MKHADLFVGILSNFFIGFKDKTNQLLGCCLSVATPCPPNLKEKTFWVVERRLGGDYTDYRKISFGPIPDHGRQVSVQEY